MYNPFQQTSTLASNATADEDDTVAAKQAFGQLGYYQTPRSTSLQKAEQ